MYSFHKLQNVSVNGFQKFFSDLPLDPFLKEKCRFRRFSRFQLKAKTLVRLDHKYFVQSGEHNKLLGDVKRDYSELDDRLAASEELSKLIIHFLDACRVSSKEKEIGVHQIRITSTPRRPGTPSPEGVHVDGFDYVGIFCADKYNVRGGETSLYKPKATEPIYRRTLERGELLVLDDKRLMHCTSAIHSLTAEGGSRDVFILTLSNIEKSLT